MDFLIEVILGLANGDLCSGRKYIIDVKKYPKPIIYLVTILYSILLLGVIGVLFVVGIMGIKEGFDNIDECTVYLFEIVK